MTRISSFFFSHASPVGALRSDGVGQLTSLRLRLLSWWPARPMTGFTESSRFVVVVQNILWTPLTVSMVWDYVRTMELHHDASGRLCFDESLVFAEEGMDAPNAIAVFNYHFLRRFLAEDDPALALPGLCLYRAARELWPHLMFHTPMSLIVHAASSGRLAGLAPEDLLGLTDPQRDLMLFDALSRQLNPSDLICLSASTAVDAAPVINGLAVDPHWFSTDCAPGYSLQAGLEHLGVLECPEEDDLLPFDPSCRGH